MLALEIGLLLLELGLLLLDRPHLASKRSIFVLEGAPRALGPGGLGGRWRRSLALRHLGVVLLVLLLSLSLALSCLVVEGRAPVPSVAG